jgi:hypothetical protein
MSASFFIAISSLDSQGSLNYYYLHNQMVPVVPVMEQNHHPSSSRQKIHNQMVPVMEQNHHPSSSRQKIHNQMVPVMEQNHHPSDIPPLKKILLMRRGTATAIRIYTEPLRGKAFGTELSVTGFSDCVVGLTFARRKICAIAR